MGKLEIPEEIIEFLSKWAVATKQDPEIASKRFWGLMIANDISDETKESTINKWVDEAGFDYRT